MNSIRLYKIFFLLILLHFCVMLQFSYAQEFENNENGIIIHNEKPLWGSDSKILLEFIQTIGHIDATDDNLIMYDIEDVERDRSGNIYILDFGNKRIQKFDKNGKFKKTIGGPGEGPGEFEMPMWFDMDIQGNIYVGEPFSSKIKILNNEGEELKRFIVKYSSMGDFRLIEGKKLIFGITGPSTIGFSSKKPDRGNYRLFSIYNLKGDSLYTIGKPMFYDGGATEAVSFLSIDGGIKYEVDDSGNIYLTYRYRNRIEKRDAKRHLIFRADRPVSIVENDYKEENGRTISPNVVSVNIGLDHKKEDLDGDIHQRDTGWRTECAF